MTKASKLALIAAMAAIALGLLALRLSRNATPGASSKLALAPRNELASSEENAASVLPLDAEPVPRETTAEPEFARTSGAEHFVIQGVVRDEQGLPVAGAKVLAEGARGKAFGAMADEHGEFRFRALAAGRWTIRASAAEHLAMTRPLLLEGTASIEPLELVLAREPRLTVYVLTPAGDPHPETITRSFSAIATAERPPALLTAKARAESTIGTWNSDGGSNGRLGVLELPEPAERIVSLVFGDAVIATETVSRGAPSVTFVLAAHDLEQASASVTMRFLGLDDPAAPMAVSVLLQSGSGILSGAELEADGRATIEGLAPDTYKLTAVLDFGVREFLAISSLPDSNHDAPTSNRTRISRAFRLAPGEALDLGDLVAGAGARLRVHVEAPGPIHDDVYVAWSRGDLGAGDRLRVKDGGVEFDCLEPGPHVVRVSTEGRPADMGARRVLVLVRAGELAEVTLRLEPVGGLVLKPAGLAALGTRYRVIDEGTGLVNSSGEVTLPQPLRLSLPRGGWRLELETPAGVQVEQRVIVGAEPVTIPLQR